MAIVRAGARVVDGILTLYDTLFQEGFILGPDTDRPSLDYNSVGRDPPIFRLSCSRFTRRY
jgi:hypothetical protein